MGMHMALDPDGQDQAPRSVDAVVVGAGFGGLYMVHKLHELGLSTICFEAGGGVGGTWYWNRYPGARCDVESMDYSYSFSPELEQEWVWSERYPSQPELLRYLEHVADRFDLRRDIQFDTQVQAASYDDRDARWLVTTAAGEHVSAQYLVMATGLLSVARVPDFPGLAKFTGPIYRTSHWPHEGVDFTGLRVAVIGTGSSGIQAIPEIAQVAQQLTVFQRTPNFSLPAHNRALDEDRQRELKKTYRDRRQQARTSASGLPMAKTDEPALSSTEDQRRQRYEQRWTLGGFQGILSAYNDLLVSPEANATAADFVRAKIAGIVADPQIAQRLMPRDHPIGTKRPCVDTNYYATFNRPNVSLVSLRESPITDFSENTVSTTAGAIELDVLVLATGFDAMTGALLAIDIRGRDGVSLRAEWADGPRTYLGVAVAGFPNLFTVTGPQSPSALSNVVTSIEQHVEWISDLLQALGEQELTTVEPTAEAQARWVEHVNLVANSTLYPSAASWYMGANIPGKPRIFMPYIGGVGNYRARMEQIAASGYEGFRLTREGADILTSK
jgi:cation diffusion facilitator CzcD-associated flavoprotein CzcO